MIDPGGSAATERRPGDGDGRTTWPLSPDQGSSNTKSAVSWSQIIRRELLGLLTVDELAPRVQQSIQQILLDFGENQGAAMRHGLLPEGSSVAPLPNQKPPDGPFYLIDLDVYRSFALTDSPIMDPEGIALRVQDYHRMIYRLFRWAVTDQYLESLGGRPDAD